MPLYLYKIIHYRYIKLFVLTVCIFNNDSLCNPGMWDGTEKLLLSSCIMGTFPGMTAAFLTEPRPSDNFAEPKEKDRHKTS